MRIGALALLLLLACGGGPGSFSGTVQTHQLEVKDALLVGNAEVWLSGTPTLCPKLMQNQLPKLGTILKLQLRPVAEGDFMVVPSSTANQTASSSFLKLNDACANTVPFQGSFATKGTVTVTRYDTGKFIAGTFDMTFGDTDAVKGTFNATFCDAPTSYPSADCVTAE